MIRARLNPSSSLTRPKAARLLRAARSAGPERAGEAIGWALCAMPERRQVRCMKVDYLLSIGNYDSADALLARCIMTGMDHPLIRLRWARSLFEQGRQAQADGEIRGVLDVRPHHGAALALAAAIASAMCDHQRAVKMLLLAARQKPGNIQIQYRLIEAMLAAGMVDDAAEVLRELEHPPAALAAGILRMQGRMLDAVELLEQALPLSSCWKEREPICLELLDLLEAIGDVPRLANVVEFLEGLTIQGNRSTPMSVQIRTARALLVLGDGARAAARLRELAQVKALDRIALAHLVVAEALNGHVERANDALDQMNDLARMTRRNDRAGWREQAPPSESAAPIAEIWLRGLLGRMTVDQTDARHAGADPSIGLLQPLLRDAMGVLESALQENDGGRSDLDRALLEHHRAACLHAMGRSAEALACLTAAAELEAKADMAQEPAEPSAGTAKPSQRLAA